MLVEDFDDIKSGFRITFRFANDNPYFSNQEVCAGVTGVGRADRIAGNRGRGGWQRQEALSRKRWMQGAQGLGGQEEPVGSTVTQEVGDGVTGAGRAGRIVV